MLTLPDQSAPLHIVVLDDDGDRAARTGRALEQRISCRVSAAACSAAVGRADLVVIASPPLAPGDRRRLLGRFASAAVLIVSSIETDEVVIDWIAAGAADVVSVDDCDRISGAAIRILARSAGHALLTETPARVLGAVGKSGRLRSLVSFLQVAAMTDPLTGLANRRAMDARLSLLWSGMPEEKGDLSILTIDIDDFKGLNDRFGHARGDAVLVALAESLRAQCRKADLAARLGGDEVLVILPGVDADQACAVADRLREDFGRRIMGVSDETSLAVGLSIGVASRQRTAARSVAELVQRSDEALYAAKRSGKGCTRVCAGGEPADWRMEAG